MKTLISIEQFENGITIVESDESGNVSSMVSLDDTKEKDIGIMVWANIHYIMNSELKSKVQLEITYKAIE